LPLNLVLRLFSIHDQTRITEKGARSELFNGIQTDAEVY
jgi:Protein of unknown function (DUF1822)